MGRSVVLYGAVGAVSRRGACLVLSRQASVRVSWLSPFFSGYVASSLSLDSSFLLAQFIWGSYINRGHSPGDLRMDPHCSSRLPTVTVPTCR